jgi:hypothetical protein
VTGRSFIEDSLKGLPGNYYMLLSGLTVSQEVDNE